MPFFHKLNFLSKIVRIFAIVQTVLMQSPFKVSNFFRGQSIFSFHFSKEPSLMLLGWKCANENAGDLFAENLSSKDDMIKAK